MTEEEYRILEDLYMTRWPDNKRGNSLMKKCEALYDLARRAEGGCIVELGTHHGCGAISLAFGARAGDRLPVYTVDDFVGRKGWAGERYYPQDRARFLDCVKVADVQVTLVRKSVIEAGSGWTRHVSLLFWDLGMEGRLSTDLVLWGRHIAPGGTFAIREGDSRKGRRMLGSEAVMATAVDGGGWSFGEQFPAGHVYTLVKRVAR